MKLQQRHCRFPIKDLCKQRISHPDKWFFTLLKIETTAILTSTPRDLHLNSEDFTFKSIKIQEFQTLIDHFHLAWIMPNSILTDFHSKPLEITRKRVYYSPNLGSSFSPAPTVIEPALWAYCISSLSPAPSISKNALWISLSSQDTVNTYV